MINNSSGNSHSNRDDLNSKYERIYLENGHCDVEYEKNEDISHNCKENSFIIKRMNQWVNKNTKENNKILASNKGYEVNTSKKMITLNKLKKEIERVMMMNINNNKDDKDKEVKDFKQDDYIEDKKDNYNTYDNGRNKKQEVKKKIVKNNTKATHNNNNNSNSNSNNKAIEKKEHKPKVSSAIYIRNKIPKLSRNDINKFNKEEDNHSITFSLQSYLSNNISENKYREKMHTSLSGIDLGFGLIPIDDKNQDHPQVKSLILNEENASNKLLKAKQFNRNRITNSNNKQQNPITSYSTKPIPSIISKGVNIIQLNNKLKPFDLSKSSIDNINYNKIVNGPTLLINDISFKEEINEILELNLPIIHSNSSIIDNRLFNNKSHSLQLAATPPIDLSKFGAFITTLSKAENSMKHYLNNFLSNYLSKLNKKCHLCQGKINELNSLWEQMSISYIVRKKVLDILLSKPRNQIEEAVDNEIRELVRFDKDNHYLYELIVQREDLRTKVLHNAERRNLLDLNRKIDNELKINEHQSKYDIVWKGLKYDWIMKYDVYTQMKYNSGE